MSGLNVLRALHPEEERIAERIASPQRVDMWQAEKLLAAVRTRIEDEGYGAIEGPKLIRERVIEDGKIMHVVTVMAIVRKLPPATVTS